MKILMLARFGPHDNCDEDAIAHALRELGHEVFPIQEKRRHRKESWAEVLDLADVVDWCLFLKHQVVSELVELSQRVPLAYWYFDLVDGRLDPTLRARSETRIRWMGEVTPLCRVGFLTDGQWVEAWNQQDLNHPLVHLPQGADERYVGKGDPIYPTPPIIFTGMINHGTDRASHVVRLKEKFKAKFSVFGNDQRDRVHGRELANVFASTKVVVAPDGPGNDLYTSNRVFLTTGLGGFILHPQCQFLHQYYRPGEDLHYYVSRDHCEELIAWYLDNPKAAQDMAARGYERCLSHNLYRHRAETLVNELRRRG